jgi:pachytene checkpoint protein 2
VAPQARPKLANSLQLCEAISRRLIDSYDTVTIGQHVDGFEGLTPSDNEIILVEIADYTGPQHRTGYHELSNIQLDVQAYVLKANMKSARSRSITQSQGDEVPKPNILELPHASLHDAWSTLVFDDALPARLLRYLVRMVSMMSRPGLNLATFNWNRLCLLHGPPGSGKSTLCRALAQKLSIRLGNVFDRSMLVEINTNAMLSKYFGESGKLINAMFENIHTMSQDRSTLVCVVMDEVETIAGSRTKSTSGTECNDGMRATNQLLTALDRLRGLPNIIVICTSNLIDSIDCAFLDRVDIKQLIPVPSQAAIYNIFRSCINELIRSELVDSHTPGSAQPSSDPVAPPSTPPNNRPTTRPKKRAKRNPAPVQALQVVPSSSPSLGSAPQTLPTFSELQVKFLHQASSPAYRVWDLAKRCHGLSGRTLRRLPILGLAMYTWGGRVGVDEAVTALEKAVEQEMLVVKREDRDVVEVNGE